MNAGPLPVQTGAGRIAGIDLNRPRIRAAPSAALALAPASGGFTAAGFTAKVGNLTRHGGYATRQAGYDLRKFRAKDLADKPGRPAATTSHRTPPAPSPRCSPSATMSSRPSWPGP